MLDQGFDDVPTVNNPFNSSYNALSSTSQVQLESSHHLTSNGSSTRMLAGGSSRYELSDGGPLLPSATESSSYSSPYRTVSPTAPGLGASAESHSSAIQSRLLNGGHAKQRSGGKWGLGPGDIPLIAPPTAPNHDDY